MDVPGYPYPPYPVSAKGKVDNPGGRYPFALEAITTGIRDATITGQPYPVKGWITYATNLMRALPNEAETIKAIQALDLLVVVDVIPSEMAGWADVVLPEIDLPRALRRSQCRDVPRTVRRPAPAGGPVAARSEAELVDCARAREEARPRGLLPLDDDRGVPRLPADEGGAQLRGAEAEGHHPRPGAAGLLRPGREAGVPDPVGQDRVLLDAASRERVRSGADVHAARGAARRHVPAAVRPVAGPLVRPHAVQPAAQRDDGRQRGVAERRRRGAPRPGGRALRAAAQPGRHRQQPGAS